MLSGQEPIQELWKRYPQTKKMLENFGVTLPNWKEKKWKNLAHAALDLKISLSQILYELGKMTGEKVQPVHVKGLDSHGLRKGLKKGVPDGVKRVIAVHSGKGGVGKTFITVNLAVFLAEKGYKVGILDADIDCPNVLLAMGMKGKLVANSSKKIVPLQKHGVKVVSMASVEEMAEKAILWRGPIISKVIEQFIHDTDWGKLDFLLVDLPPGTSDAPLSVLQILQGAEVLVVTTGQKLALMDAKKSIQMCRELQVPLLGLLENMGGDIFGGIDKLSVKKLAKESKIPFLGSIPLQVLYAVSMEKGEPAILKDTQLPLIFNAFSLE